MLVSHKFGDASSSFALSVLCRILQSPEKNKRTLCFSPTGLMQLLDIFRNLMSKDSTLYETINKALYYHGADSELKDLLESLAEVEENETTLSLSLSMWGKWNNIEEKNKKILKRSLSKFSTQKQPVDLKTLGAYSDIRSWAKNKLKKKPVFENLTNKEEKKLILCSATSAKIHLNLDSSTKACEDMSYFKNADFEAIRFNLSDEKLYCDFVFPFSEKDELLQTAKTLSDPFYWREIQEQLSSSSNQTSFIKINFSPINFMYSFSLLDDYLKSAFFGSEKNFAFDKNLKNCFGFFVEPAVEENQMTKKDTKALSMCDFLQSTLVKFSISESSYSLSNHKKKTKIEHEINFSEKSYIFFVHHEQSSTMLFCGFRNSLGNKTEQTDSDHEKVKYRAGKSPPRGETDFDASFKKNPTLVQNKQKEQQLDQSVINRKLIPCPSYSETGECTYGKMCRFSHEVAAINASF